MDKFALLRDLKKKKKKPSYNPYFPAKYEPFRPVRKAKSANLAPNPRPKAGKPHLNPRLALKSARRFPLGPLALMEVALE
jgi:hypothetical protein